MLMVLCSFRRCNDDFLFGTVIASAVNIRWLLRTVVSTCEVMIAEASGTLVMRFLR